MPSTGSTRYLVSFGASRLSSAPMKSALRIAAVPPHLDTGRAGTLEGLDFPSLAVIEMISYRPQTE